MKRFLLLLVLFSVLISAVAQQNDSLQLPQPKTDTLNNAFRVYTYEIKEQIAPPVWRTTQKAFENAYAEKADLMLIHMNTYGGLVDAADSIRTKILNAKIPVYVFIDNNAASAGALISIACDSIYMISGANIGAATVVNQSGEVVPDKFQSYMRSMMRSTAEAKGRDPMIAQAMVDPSIYVAGVSDSGKVLTFTTSEAIKFGFAEGQASSLEEVLELAGHENYEIIPHTLSTTDKIINKLIHPAVSGILIMIIIGGLYFEIQTPGIGFPIAASVIAALLYFAPLYLEGLASNWEVLVFVIGVILLLVEVFAIPGFGVAGVTGISLIVASLSFAMVDSIGDSPFSVNYMALAKSFFIVIIAVFSSMVLSLYLSQKLFGTNRYGHLALDTVQNKSEGFTSANLGYTAMIGKNGKTFSILRPSGKVIIDGEMYDATALSGYIEADTEIEVLSYHTGQLFVRKA